MRNKANFLILVTTLLMGAALTLWLDDLSSPPASVPAEDLAQSDVFNGETVPIFSFTDLTGKSHTITDFKGKTVIINFWATWCAPCIIEFPKLLRLARDNPDIILIALSSDSENWKIEAFLKKNQRPTENVILARDDKRAITTDIFNTYKLPESIIISPSGSLVRKIVGDTDWNGKEISDLLNSLKG